VNNIKEIRYASGFSGIGGFELGLNRNGFKRVWSNDINKYANQVYTNRFGSENHYSGDIRGINPEDIPPHDLFCGGFPCQAFSVAGKRHGFKDTRGTLFFEICRIAEFHRPSMLLLENVKGLLSHDGGRTFATILNSLEELGYWWEYQVLNSKYFGVPQNRERVFIIGHLRGTGGQEVFPITEANQYTAGTQETPQGTGTRVRDEDNSVAGSLRVGGSGREENLIASTISARYGKDGSENLVSIEHKKITERSGEYGTGFKEDETFCLDSSCGRDQVLHFKDTRIRRLTPVECERLQGFPDNWTEGLSDTQRYKCLGNAVTVNVIEYLGSRTKLSLCVEEEK